MSKVSSLECLLTEKDAAAILSVQVATLRRWRWSGQGPTFRKIGACVRYRPEDLVAFIEAAGRQCTSEVGRAA
jgi:hypothetical protein